MSGPDILLSAGEASGDHHGAALARALRRRWPDARLWGLGGPGMAAEGVELLAGLDRLAVMGFAEVVRHLPYFAGLLRRVGGEIHTRRPDLVVPIDYPGFNMRLARRAAGAGIPVLYYVAPQVWAWRRARARRLARTTDRVAVILPFEASILEAAGVDVEFVGHPLLGERPAPIPRAELCRALGVDPDLALIALLPGSRRQELRRHLDRFLEAGRAAAAATGASLAIARAPGVDESAIEATGIPSTADAWALLSHARAALVKSGTGTLQAAIADTPMVVAYRTSGLTYRLARSVVHVPWVSLVNLVADAPVVPEYIQEEASADALAGALAGIVADGAKREAMREGLARVRTALAPPTGSDPAERVAGIAAELLAARGGA